MITYKNKAWLFALKLTTIIIRLSNENLNDCKSSHLLFKWRSLLLNSESTNLCSEALT